MFCTPPPPSVKAWCKATDSGACEVLLSPMLTHSLLTAAPPTLFYKQGNWGTERVLIAQSCRTHCHCMNCILPGSSVHGISLATGVGCHFLLQTKMTQLELNPGSLALKFIYLRKMISSSDKKHPANNGCLVHLRRLTTRCPYVRNQRIVLKNYWQASLT